MVAAQSMPLPHEDEPKPKEVKYKPDDDEIALHMAEDWKGRYRYLHATWHEYEGGYWQSRNVQEMRQYVRVYLRRFRSHGIRVSNGQVNALESLLQADMYYSDREYMRRESVQENYINLQNGLFDLTAHKLIPHDPELCFTSQLNFEFDPKAQCPMFERFLATSLVNADETPDEQMIALVQEAIGYSMTARTDLKASFWLIGPQDSGKSTLVAFVRGLMGSLATTIDLNQLAANRFLLSGIIGKRVVTFTEASENSVLPDALYKAMTGGSDEIYADVKNKPGIAFRPIAKFWWGMNSSPRITDRTGATFRRLKPIVFRRTVPVNRRISDLDRLMLRELPGVFNWAMDGYMRLLERGAFTDPEYSKTWLEQYKYDNDPARQFLDQDYERDPDSRVQSTELMRRFKHWRDENGYSRNYSFQKAAQDWERLGLEREKSNDTYWKGIKPKYEKFD